MNSRASSTLTLAEAAHMSPQQVVDLSSTLVNRIDVLTKELDWLKRQVFGQKSERRLIDNPAQIALDTLLSDPASVTAQPVLAQVVPEHVRRKPRSDAAQGESTPFFDESRVPMCVVRVTTPQMDALAEGTYQQISVKESFRLAQEPASFVIIKYLRPVFKRNDNGELLCAPAPVGVIEGSRADVSFCAGLLVSKFRYHLPFYRQHQQLADAGITVSRPWLNQLSQQICALLEPIYNAQLTSIRNSRVIAMDETPIKAGQAGKGKMKTGYFWPVYGDQDEVCFPFATTRAHAVVAQTLGLHHRDNAVLVSDGYAAYARYAQQTGITHAQCWAHCRREFFDAQSADPQAAALALQLIGTLYQIEQDIRDQRLSAEDKQSYRATHSKPQAEWFFAWVEHQRNRSDLLPSNPFKNALNYAWERRVALSVYLADPDVPIDTNHLERSLRPIPMGRRNWLFCWTELGAKHVGIAQSLIVTCRLHGIDPYTYLVDVLQRVGLHPASRVDELTPRLWKHCFAHDPLRSLLAKVHREGDKYVG